MNVTVLQNSAWHDYRLRLLHSAWHDYDSITIRKMVRMVGYHPCRISSTKKAVLAGTLSRG